MFRLMRPALAVAVALGLSGFSLPKVSLPKLHVPALTKPAKLDVGEWPQAHSDLPADPDTRFGALPNGMRYAIRRQTTPPGQSALRLQIDAGSLMETDAQQGLAHFLEHMAFNGSKAVPEGEMIKILERLGLAFGADTNASTDFEQTQYRLDLPRSDDETVDTSLMLLREAASNLTLEPAAVDRERGVVLSEERARDTPGYRIYQDRLAFLLAGQRPPLRLPIGKVDVLKTAPASQITDFYRRYYRPERATLVATGDFDPAVMEAKIKARFSDWVGSGPAGADPELGAVRSRKPQAKLKIEPGAGLSIQIAWVRAPDLSPDTGATRQKELLQRLGFSVLNRRLQALSRGQNPAFLSAGAFEAPQFHAADVTVVVINADAADWKPALAGAEQEVRRLAQYGVSQVELDREIEELRAGLKASVSAAATRTPSDLAGEITDAVADDRVVTSPADELAAFEAAVKGLRPEAIASELKPLFKGQGPLIFMTSPKAVEGGEATLLAAYTASAAVAVKPATGNAVVAWPYTSFGPPGEVIDTKSIVDLDATFLRFSNGVRLTVKPTKFKDDEVLVRVNIGAGRTVLPRDQTSLAWAANAFMEGGLRQIDAQDMERVLASRVYGGRFSITDDAFVLTGETRPADLDVQLQVLSAYLAEPGWRPEAFERIKRAGKSIHDQYEATDSGVLARDLSGLLHGQDPRWTFPSREAISGAKLSMFQALLTPHLNTGAIEVIVVGDISVEKATDLVAQTFGALPSRPDPASPDAAGLNVKFPGPTATPLQLTHKGRSDQAIGFMAWPTNDFNSDPQGARDADVMADVFENRLLQELREKQGATYSPQVNSSHSQVWPGWGYVSANVEVSPEKLPGFITDVRQIAADLRGTPPTADELARAKKPRLDGLEKARETNGYWLSELSHAQTDARKLDAVRSAVSGVERVSGQDVQRAAQKVLRDETLWMLEVKPQTSPSGAAQ